MQNSYNIIHSESSWKSYFNPRFHHKELFGVFTRIDSETGFIRINDFINSDFEYFEEEYKDYIKRTDYIFQRWVEDNYYTYLAPYEGYNRMEFENINTNDSSVWDQFQKNRTNLYYHSNHNQGGYINLPMFDGWYVNPKILNILIKHLNPSLYN